MQLLVLDDALHATQKAMDARLPCARRTSTASAVWWFFIFVCFVAVAAPCALEARVAAMNAPRLEVCARVSLPCLLVVMLRSQALSLD